jgi:hypothetical protein
MTNPRLGKIIPIIYQTRIFYPLNSQKGNFFPTWEFKKYFYVPLFSRVWENSHKIPNQDILPIFSPCYIQQWEKDSNSFPKKEIFYPTNSQIWEMFQHFPNMRI